MGFFHHSETNALISLALALMLGFIVGVAMAGHAVLEVCNAFLQVLGPDLVLAMFVTAVAGELLEISTDVAGRARRVVIAVEFEEFGVIECGRCPGVGFVALRAVGGEVAVEIILRPGVTALAARAGFGT